MMRQTDSNQNFIAMCMGAFILISSGIVASTKDVEDESEPKVGYVTTDDFESKVLNSKLPVLVDFTATWCVPCKEVDPIIESLMPEMSGHADIYKLDIDESAEIYQRLQVNGVPHILFFKDGREEDRISSPQPREIYVKYLKAMIEGRSTLDVSLELLTDDPFRRHFILTRSIEDLRTTLQKAPNLLLDSFENGQSPLALVLNRPSVRQNDQIGLILEQDPTITARDFVGLGRCSELQAAIDEDPEVVNRPDPDGNAPILTALSRSHRLEDGGCLRTLLDADVDVTIPNTQRNSLGRAVVLKNDAHLLQEFLDRGMDPTFDDELGRNALHWAVYYGFVSNVKVLVEYGVDLSLKTFDGETAADIVRNLRARRFERLTEVDADAQPDAVTYYKESIKEYDEILAMLETT